MIVEPYGCADCGEGRLFHGSRFTRTLGLHKWIKPSDQHILARMTYNREQRRQAKLDELRRRARCEKISEVHKILSDPGLSAGDRLLVKQWAFPLLYGSGMPKRRRE